MSQTILKTLGAAAVIACLAPIVASEAAEDKYVKIILPTANANHKHGPVTFKVVLTDLVPAKVKNASYTTVLGAIQRYYPDQKKWFPSPNGWSAAYNLKDTPNGKDIWSIVKTPGKYRIKARLHHGPIDLNSPLKHFTSHVYFSTGITARDIRRKGLKKRYPKPRIGPPPVQKIRPPIKPKLKRPETQ